MKKKNSRILIRILISLFILAILTYTGIIGYVCLAEGSVLKTVPASENYDAIIVLGAQVTPDGSPSVQLGWRLDAAYDAWKQKAVPVVVCGARGKDEPVAEADAMDQYLVNNGIPASDILKDPDSYNTNQNLQNAAALLQNLADVRKVLIVTSDYHVPRSLAIAKDLGYDACGMGSPCKPEYWLKNHARDAQAWCKYWGQKYLHLPLE